MLPSYRRPAPRSVARRNGPSRSTISACCATSSAGAILSDGPIVPPAMIRKPRRFASSASANASVSPPALSSLILMAWYFPSSRSRSARVRQDSSAQSGIGTRKLRRSLRAAGRLLHRRKGASVWGARCGARDRRRFEAEGQLTASMNLFRVLYGGDRRASRPRIDSAWCDLFRATCG